MFLKFPRRIREQIAFEGYGIPGTAEEGAIRIEPKGKQLNLLVLPGIGEITMSHKKFQALARAVREHERRS